MGQMVKTIIKDVHIKEAIKGIEKDVTTHKSYKEFIRYFDNLKKIKERHLIISAHFTYGWMPTILTLHGELDECLDILHPAKTDEEIAQDQFEKVCHVINNSSVGASKLLHFINPMIYPIWDSRVCRFLEHPEHLRRNKESYFQYMDCCKALVKEKNFSLEHKKIKDAVGYKISPIRAVELIMFYNGQKKKK
jgi:hypothetical protein